MCRSPHEMTTERIEYLLAQLHKRQFEYERTGRGDDWSWRIAEFEKLLKERAEAGTYA